MASNERIGRALNSNNLRQDELHSDVDVIAALAFASRLGSSLQSLKSGGHLNQLPDSVYLLSLALIRSGRRKRIGISRDKAEMVSRQALLEWLIQICRSCNGTGHKLSDYTVKPVRHLRKKNSDDMCPHCNGTGKFMPTWAWRRQMMSLNGEESKAWWEKRIEFAKEIADDAYHGAKRKVTVQLTDLLSP